MNCARTRKQRRKPLDLKRRAMALGVSWGHLSRVLSGKRESRSLLAKYTALIQSETPQTSATPIGQNDVERSRHHHKSQ